MANQAAIQDVTRGFQLLQPEMNALIQKVVKMEGDTEKKNKELENNKEALRAEEREFYERMGMEKQKLQEEWDKHYQQMKWERTAFEVEKEEFKKAQILGEEIAAQQRPVTVEVGGEKFRTELRTLRNCQGSVFPKLVEALERRDDQSKRDPYIFIDRDSKHFRFILNYLRQGAKVMRWSAMKNPDHCILSELLDEAKYYNISGLERLLLRKKASLTEKVGFDALVRAKYFAREGSQAYYKTTREVCLKDLNLCNIVFTKVEFCHPVTFENCMMISAKFSECRVRSALAFSNVDLRKASFVQCEGIKQLTDLGLKDTDTADVEIVPVQGRR